MHRPSTLTDQATSAQVVNNVQYGAANQVLGITYFGVTESRTYNARLQLKSLNGLLNLQYTYSPDQNNGKITTRKDVASGEEVSYQYDTLNRLISATTTAASDAVTTPWGQSYGYHAFGNLTNKTVTKGTGPTLNLTVDAATNRFPTALYDANRTPPPPPPPHPHPPPPPTPPPAPPPS